MDSKTLALIFTVALAATSLSQVNQTADEFESYKVTFGKSYEAEEETVRRAIFNANVENINAHNADETQTYKQGINKFTDMTNEEFKAAVLMPKRASTPAVDDDLNETASVNWVTKGAVQKVKDQGQCGSCWAFSAAGSSESFKWIKTNVLGDFSEQELVSCSHNGGNAGCNGGLEYYGMQYYIDNGICTEASYPYTSGGGSVASCKLSSCTKDSFDYSSYKLVKGTSALKTACNAQPVSVAVDAEKWSSYTSGIFSNCGTSLDHAVLLVGYTSSYWLIKNSWGTSWGESGYIRLAPGDTCGLADDASHPSD